MAVTNGYADADDVQALLDSGSGTGLTLGTASVPTLAQAETWLDQVAAEVDGVLKGAGYGTVPATGTSDVLMIGRHVAQKAASIVYHAGWGGFGDEPKRVTHWEAEYEAFLEGLAGKGDGPPVRLVDQSPSSKMGVVNIGRYIGD
jgi:hypothetical protein